MTTEANDADVVELVLTPFSDIVAKAQNAAAIAGAQEPQMFEAAEALRKEGQRALNRLVPLYRKIVKQHGMDCANAVKMNEDIVCIHLELTDVLWEFDDYLSVEGFDKGKYGELQSLCRRLAPKMYNILVRMNIELLAQVVSSASSSSASSASSSSSATSINKIAPRHTVTQSPPSPMFSVSSSTDAWHPSPFQISRDESDLPAAAAGDIPWDDNNRLQVHVKDASSSENQDSGSSPSVTSFDLILPAVAAKRQSHNSDHSAQSSNSRRSLFSSIATRSMLTIRESEDAQVMQQLPRQISASHRITGVYSSENLRRRVNFEHATMPVSRAPSGQCMITESSSFRQYKGFCLGAQEVLQGGDGVKQKQKPVQRTLLRIVAKCNACSMELDYGDIETDLAGKQAGNLVQRDVGYRLRFLQKSHLPVKRSSDAIYGCIFCISNGFTVEESDATVFFSAEDLFLHLSRHSRPLPPVPGIAVVYGIEVPYDLRNNYDLHFHMPPKIHPMHEASTEIDGRPTGTALKETRKVDPHRKLGERDRPVELQLAIGARITGIKWPPQYKGRKIFAWHDGKFASVPSENIMLIPPENIRLSKSIRSRTFGKAKWKFSMTSGNKELPWLKFDKGDTITNIGWEHPDHWCWCGMNAKGHWDGLMDHGDEDVLRSGVDRFSST
ncbi:hypothetical protein E4U42_003286 [Claviceps africana]|uniref:SH3 domain-containing protein n=1 Tax=Claviceps africana TaxID=83212 RepID=A0A8K0J878_9HYPO|nr:hypothetical protein E4U42_003286 [Claviceps africana]